jgi:hypothetical protein
LVPRFSSVLLSLGDLGFQFLWVEYSYLHGGTLVRGEQHANEVIIIHNRAQKACPRVRGCLLRLSTACPAGSNFPRAPTDGLVMNLPPKWHLCFFSSGQCGILAIHWLLLSGGQT